jgi:membrane associated rhomboid family serine protease
MPIFDEIKQSFKQGGALTRLIYVNLGVFVVIRLLYAFSSLIFADAYFPLDDWLSVPASPMRLLLQPWSIITYMFLHFQFLHILVNMLYLFWFGNIFLQYFNPRQLLGVYFMGGIAGALMYILSYNIFPVLNQNFSGSVMMGASASVMAVLWAAARYAPNTKIHLLIIGPVKLIYIALFSFVFDFIGVSSLANTGGHLAHIGGALLGVFFASQMLKGKDITMRFNRFMDWLVSLFSRRSKMKVTYTRSKRPVSDMEFNAQKRKRQSHIDRILEKIKASGYDSLTKQEKEDLFNASNN